MTKININSKISSRENKLIKLTTKGIIKDNKITYFDNDTSVCILILPNEIKLIRENKENKINLIFKENENQETFCLLKDLNMNIKVQTITKYLKINKNSFDVKYELYFDGELSDIFDFNVEWSEI